MHNSYQGHEVMHVGLMVHNPRKWYEYTHEWVGGAQFQYWGQSYTCDAKLLGNASKLCTWGLVVHNSQIRSKLCTWGLWCIIPKEGTKLHKSWLAAHNF